MFDIIHEKDKNQFESWKNVIIDKKRIKNFPFQIKNNEF